MGIFSDLLGATAPDSGRNTSRFGGYGNGPYSVNGYLVQDKTYNPNAFQYNGYQGGLADYTSGLAKQSALREQRSAPLADYTQADLDRYHGDTARAGQQAAAEMMRLRAYGKTPSIAGAQSQQDIYQLQQGGQQQTALLQQNALQQRQAAQAAQGAQAASARGAAGVALAGQTAANNNANASAAIGRSSAQAQQNIGMGVANATQNISNQAQINAMREREQAEQGMFGAYSNLRGADQASEGLAGQRAQFQAGQQLASRNANDAMTMGYNQLTARAQEAQLGAQMQQQGMASNSYNQAMALNAGVAQANSTRQGEQMDSRTKSAGSGLDNLALGLGFMSDERSKNAPIMLNRGGKMYSPVEAKRPLTMDEMLDDRAAQPSAYYKFAPATDPVVPPASRYASPDDPNAQWERSFGSQDAARAAAREHDNAAEMQRIRDAFKKPEKADEKKDDGMGWLSMLTGKSGGESGLSSGGGGFMSDEHAKTPAERDAFLRGARKAAGAEPFSMSDEITAKQMEGKRSPKTFSRDTPATQKKVAEDYYAKLARQADEQMAAMKAAQAEGPSVRRLASGDERTGYETELTNGAEEAYRRKFGAAKGEDYDLRGAYAEGLTDRAPYVVDADSPGGGGTYFPGHLPDTYKKPNHETFSDESQYAMYGNPGHWEGDHYVPGLQQGGSGFYSDDRTKLAAAWDQGHEAAVSDVEKLSHRSPGELKQLAKSGHPLARAVVSAKGDAWDEGDRSARPAKFDPFERPGASLASMPRYEVGQQEPSGPPLEIPVAPAVPGQELPPPKPPAVENAGPPPYEERDMYDRSSFVRRGPGGAVAPPARRRMTSDERAKDKSTPDHGALANANRAMVGQPYAYKPEFTPPHEREGQPHFGFMTQNLRKSPVTSVAVEKDPETGLDHVDRDRMLQVMASGISDLQRQQDETRLMLRKGGRKR